MQLADDPEEARRMGASGKARAEAVFSIQRTVEETEVLYEELVTEIRGQRSEVSKNSV